MELSPAVAELLSSLEAEPEAASVTFFPFGLHTHLMSDGEGGWNLEVHTSRMSEEEQEEVISNESHLTTEELVFRMSSLAMLAEAYMDQMVAESNIGDEVEAFLAAGGE